MNFFSLSSTKDKVAENADDTIDAIVRASFSMGRAKTGALIVIEQKFVLNEYNCNWYFIRCHCKCTASGADL